MHECRPHTFGHTCSSGFERPVDVHTAKQRPPAMIMASILQSSRASLTRPTSSSFSRSSPRSDLGYCTRSWTNTSSSPRPAWRHSRCMAATHALSCRVSQIIWFTLIISRAWILTHCQTNSRLFPVLNHMAVKTLTCAGAIQISKTLQMTQVISSTNLLKITSAKPLNRLSLTTCWAKMSNSNSFK